MKRGIAKTSAPMAGGEPKKPRGRPPKADAEVKPKKRTRVRDENREKCRIVSRALNDADMTEKSREMLQSILDTSLALPKDARHSYQESVVEHVSAALLQVEARFEREANERQSQLDGLDAQRAKLDAEVEATAEELAKKEGAYKVKQRELADVALGFREKRSAQVAALQDREDGDRSLEHVSDNLEKLETGAADAFEPLKAGTLHSEDAVAREDAANALLKKWKNLVEMDDSLTLASVAGLVKPPAERGQFDQMAIDNLASEFTRAIEKFKAEQAGGEEAKRQRADAVASAEAALANARVAQNQLAKTFLVAEQDKKNAEEAQAKANEAVQASVKERKAAEKTVASSQKSLLGLREGALAAFAELRDRITPEEEPAEDAPAEEEEAAEEDAEA